MGAACSHPRPRAIKLAFDLAVQLPVHDRHLCVAGGEGDQELACPLKRVRGEVQFGLLAIITWLIIAGIGRVGWAARSVVMRMAAAVTAALLQQRLQRLAQPRERISGACG